MSIDEANYGWFRKKGEDMIHLMGHGGRTEHGFPSLCGQPMSPFVCVSPWPHKVPEGDEQEVCNECLAKLTFDRMGGG